MQNVTCWAALAYTQGPQSQLVLDLQNVTASRIQAKDTTELILLLYSKLLQYWQYSSQR